MRDLLYRRAASPSISLPRRALEQRRLHDHLVEAGGVRAAQPVGVRVVREAEQRHVRIRVGDVVGVDPRDVGDHEVGRVDSLGRSRNGGPGAAPRASRGGRGRPRRAGSSPCLSATITPSTANTSAGSRLARAGDYFAAHEAFETRVARGRPGRARLLPGARPRGRLRLPGRPWPARSAPSASGRRRCAGSGRTRRSTAGSTSSALLARASTCRARPSRTAGRARSAATSPGGRRAAARARQRRRLRRPGSRS